MPNRFFQCAPVDHHRRKIGVNQNFKTGKVKKDKVKTRHITVEDQIRKFKPGKGIWLGLIVTAGLSVISAIIFWAKTSHFLKWL
ncbi:hypothetical protein Ocin01_10878 [Orchesella cincta]|uniref:Uncharacterized protein n=1 Tax=Orchesella cincta TaxID=48709 RepID=A0A1D2MRY9_ORCCI|nr:hypothetical protein Ocin01_10878 [Orchesella cincta]